MREWLRVTAVVAALWFAVGEAAAQSRTLVLAADETLEASGLLAFMIPRFALKHGIRPTIVTASPDAVGGLAAEADVMVGRLEVLRPVRERGAGERLAAAFHLDGADPPVIYAILPMSAAKNADNAKIFADWLTSQIGQRTVASFAPESGARYAPGAVRNAAVDAPAIEGDANAGERLALLHCGRCHVVSEKNRMGGIGSTPSFGALRAIPGWEDKFLAFWAENPHPVFTQVEGLTEPFDPDRPPHIAPVEITQEEVEAIAAFAATIAPKDLGARVQSR